MGLVSCHGSDPEKFYDKLLAGESGVREITEFDCSEIPTRIGAPVTGFSAEDFLDKKQARRVDPCIAYAIGAGKMAVESAKLDLGKIDKFKAGVLVGSGMGGMKVYMDNVNNIVKKGLGKTSPFFVPYIITNMPGALLAIEVGFKGPNYSISTACATANYSIVAAARHIERGDADIMLTGGVEASINQLCFSGFCALKALSRRNDEPAKASRPWDINRDGFVIGEGCGVFVLEELEHALKRGAPILAEYKGGAYTCDAHHMTEPTPSGEDVSRCIDLALEEGGLIPEDIQYVNAHATATPVGDLCEIRAIKKSFGDSASSLKINGTKSLTGHALGGAAAIEFVATLMAMKRKKVHPTINLDNPEPETKGLNLVRHGPEDCHIKNAISNSFGFGGHNCVIAVSHYEG